MLLNLGRGFGSIRLDTKFRGTNFKIKVYPLLVHCIKATSGKQMLYVPGTLRSCRVRETNLINRIHKLENFNELELGGLRIEVTVKAPTLQDAKFRISQTPLLNWHEWLNPSTPEMERFKLQVKFIRKDRYIRNFKNLLYKAQGLGVFTGRDSQKVLKVRKGIIQDLYFALGWNSGIKRTSWQDHTQLPEGPWWTWQHPGRDIDAPPQVQRTSRANFLNPLSDEVHLQEIQRCVKIFKRGTKWRALIFREGRKVNFGSESSQELLAKLIYPRFKYTWTKTCYLVQEPFTSSEQLQTLTQQPLSDLDRELGKYNIQGSHIVPPNTKFQELQGSSNYKATSGYIKGDGNCQFRMLAKIIFGNQNFHNRVRETVVRYLNSNQTKVELILAAREVQDPRHPPSVPMYLLDMGRSGTWGDDATLSAAVDHYKLSLVLIRPDRTHFEINQVPHPSQWHAVYYTGNHYELVYKFN